MTEVHLGLDIGGTASRWVLCDAGGAEVARGKASGATGHVFNPAENARLKAALASIRAEIDRTKFAISSITLGMTGFGNGVADEVKAMLAEAFGVDTGRMIVIDDVVLAYMANFAPGEGHLVSAGTGSIAVHIAADGQFTRVGGRGILIDDAGAGSWIALRALDRIYRTLDHTGSFADVQLLADSLFKEIGGNDWGDVRQFVYAGDRGRIGTLAVGVAAAAEAGDATALDILREAGNELALLIEALTARIGPRPAGFIGGVLSLHRIIEETIRARLVGQDVRRLSADASLAAAQLQVTDPQGWRRVLEAMA
ncbi:BadF/BadG/BcrA/BcrD ATPase family protein [Devosia sp. SD17-2]|uniref:N-acetylglucosamine kinase n=1 Tax=Devosia sp. SD17-2 TaxID=2976459 RepID=UPI0023D8C0E5|nr:BadF/BadG/BcrA/BcrD ATPase family protein [Devosia sp. SD17-2]WEJ34224.1 hypothetical protein NYQ88_05315 [Devosia sp. SD17-2]